MKLIDRSAVLEIIRKAIANTSTDEYTSTLAKLYVDVHALPWKEVPDDL